MISCAMVVVSQRFCSNRTRSSLSANDPFFPKPGCSGVFDLTLSSVNSGSKPLRMPGTALPGGICIPEWRDEPQAFRQRTTGRSKVAPLCCSLRCSRPINLHFRKSHVDSTRSMIPYSFTDSLAASETNRHNMQPWSLSENSIVLTDLLRSQHSQQQQRDVVYVKPEPEFVSSRPGLVELPPLLPPRAPMLPAISDVLRSTSPQQQRYQYDINLPRAVSPAKTSYGLPTPSYSVDTSMYSATFMSTSRPNTSDFSSRSGFVLPSLPSPYASGDVTSPGLVGARTRPIGTPSPREASAPRPASRTCRFEGCTHYVVDHGLCVRHGGGKRCTAEGCKSRAKHFGRCWKHGGSVECKAPGCSNRAKSRGYCWSHGGGTKCKTGACDKIAISNGLCWAHGGGKRCIVPGCRKQAYERTSNYCNSHFQQYQETALELAQHQSALK